MKTVYHNFGGKQITQHDAEIIALLCMGLDRHNMALLLNNKIGTLKNEITKLYLKTGTTKCTELVTLAIQLGFDRKGNWNGVSFLPPPPKNPHSSSRRRPLTTNNPTGPAPDCPPAA